MSEITVTLSIENHYELYGRVDTTATVTVPAPPPEDDTDAYDEWTYAYIHAETGTGRTDGDAAYFVTITESTAPDLVGRKFEFGL